MFLFIGRVKKYCLSWCWSGVAEDWSRMLWYMVEWLQTEVKYDCVGGRSRQMIHVAYIRFFDNPNILSKFVAW